MSIVQRVLVRFKKADESAERTLEAAEFMNGNGVQTISIVERIRPAHYPGDSPAHSYFLRTYADHFGLNVKSETSIGSWPAAAWLADALSRTANTMKEVRPSPMSDYLPDVYIKNGEQKPRRWERANYSTLNTLTARVLARFRQAMEHPSPEARKQYLHEHPNADPANHTVAKPGDHGHGEHHEDKPKKSWKEHLQGMSEKAQKFVKNAPADLKKFFEDDAHRRSVLKGAHDKLVKAPEKLVHNVVHTVKHEVKEFQEAGAGIRQYLEGDDMTPSQKKALKTVGFHLALTAVATVLTATGGPLAGAAVFGKSMAKHVAMKSVSRALGNLHILQELGHVGHGIQHGIHHVLDKLAAEKPNPEDIMAEFFLGAAAKELANLDVATIADAVEGMDKADEKPGDE